ncbi:hypothetical protein JHK85_002621 [Glycine max]|nr:hypothetical protein JHK85_002621 [Glycine max]KAG5089943.1 hypothetical protein JHK86_002555 [Glycine max]
MTSIIVCLEIDSFWVTFDASIRKRGKRASIEGKRGPYEKVKRGLWSPEEDEKLIRYITTHGYGCWSEVPEKAGRTDNEIKNYWNSWIKKKIRKPSSVTSSMTTTQSVDHHHPQFNYNSNQLDHYGHQENLTAKPPMQETLFSSTCPLFMFDTSSLDQGTTTVDTTTNVRTELFQDSLGLSSTETWNLSHHQVHVLPPQLAATFTAATVIDTTNYLPPLIENVDNMVPNMEVQSCSIDEEGEMALECLRRQGLNEWVEHQQQCPNFLFWDSINVEGQLGGEELAPNTSFPRRTVKRSANTSSKGVCFAKKDFNLAKHPEIDVPNLQVIKLMQSFKSREYVRETFAWMHYYWFLTNDGIEFLRTYLNLPSEIVPATLKKQAKPAGRPFGGPPGDRPRGPPRFDGERRFGGDRDGYRGGPRGPGGDFGDKGGAPADYRPSFGGGPGGRPGFGRGSGGYGAPTSSNIPS